MECISKRRLLRFLPVFYGWALFSLYLGICNRIGQACQAFCQNSPPVANKQNWDKNSTLSFLKRWHRHLPYFMGFINGYLAHGSLTIMKWAKRCFYCCFDIWGIYVMTSFLLWLVRSCELVCHTFPGLQWCWIFALSWKNTNTSNHTSPHCNEDQSEKKWRMARHPRCVFKSPENSAPGLSLSFLPERAFPFRM